MALFAIGDVQGCKQDLINLLQEMRFEPQRDELWLTGDLVNRGPESLAVLRFIQQLPRCVSVLGNHDLHLLAVACVGAQQASSDTLDDILGAPDRDELLDWLRKHPLLHQNTNSSLTLVHAGISPQWRVKDAVQYAREVEAELSSPRFKSFLKSMYGNKPARWQDDLETDKRLRYITNSFTRMRYVKPNMELCFKSKGSPGSQPRGYTPWFKLRPHHADPHADPGRIIFGHWSTLGFYVDDRVIALDSGCLWGRALSGVKLSDDGEIIKHYSVSCINNSGKLHTGFA